MGSRADGQLGRQAGGQAGKWAGWLKGQYAGIFKVRLGPWVRFGRDRGERQINREIEIHRNKQT